MTDQAATLRVIRGGAEGSATSRRRAVAITGGKGGVGKSTLAVSLARAFSEPERPTLLVDADFGMADLNLLLGVAPGKTMLDIIEGGDASEAIVEKHNIALLPALSGSVDLADMTAAERDVLVEAIRKLTHEYSSTVIDIGAGIGANQNHFAALADAVVVVVSPEALSIADAYACLKGLSHRQGLKRAFVIPNRIRSTAQTDEIVGRLSALVTRFLEVQLTPLAPVPYDLKVAEANEYGVPFIVHCPDSPASRAIRRITRQLDMFASTGQSIGPRPTRTKRASATGGAE